MTVARIVPAFVVAGPAACAGAAWAHAPAGDGVTGALHATWDLWALILLALSATLYCIGTFRLRRRVKTGGPRQRRRALLFAGGWLVAALALLPPVDTVSGQLFSVHMVQHELLMLVAAPLLVLSAPGSAFAWSLPTGPRRGTSTLVRRMRRTWRFLTRPGVAWLVHAAILWGWHAPVLFDAALRNDLVHSAQHLSFFLAAGIFWSSLRPERTRPDSACPEPTRIGSAMLSLFTTAVHASALGALFTFSNRMWYAPYLETTSYWGLSPLEDQQLGGLIMWVPGGAAYLLAALWLLGRWLHGDGGEGPGTAA